MTPDVFIAVVFGVIVGFFVATVIFAVKWNEEHDRAERAENENKLLTETLEKQYDEMNPHVWVDSDDPAIQKSGRERMHDRHPTLVQPGTEVIRIDSVLPDPELWQDVDGAHGDEQ